MAMSVGEIIALVRTLEDVIKADEETRVKAYGTEYKRISGLVADRIVEELYRMDQKENQVREKVDAAVDQYNDGAITLSELVKVCVLEYCSNAEAFRCELQPSEGIV